MPENVGSMIMKLLPLLAIVVLMIVMTIIPQRKRDKQVKEMMDNLKKGDVVRTIGGLHGRIVTLKEDVVVLETGPDKVKLVFSRSAIATVGDADVEADGLTQQDVRVASEGVGKKKKEK